MTELQLYYSKVSAKNLREERVLWGFWLKNLRKEKFVELITDLSNVADSNFDKIAYFFMLFFRKVFSLKLSVTFSILISEEKAFTIS